MADRSYWSRGEWLLYVVDLKLAKARPAKSRAERQASRHGKGEIFPDEVRAALEKMMLEAPTRPGKGKNLTYPTKDVVDAVIAKYGLTLTQVKNYASNYRRRVQKTGLFKKRGKQDL